MATFVRSFLAFSSLSISIFWAFAEKEQKLQEALETLQSYPCLYYTILLYYYNIMYYYYITILLLYYYKQSHISNYKNYHKSTFFLKKKKSITAQN